MSAINDGGPAFPTDSVSQNQATGETTVYQPFGGMSLRDYFAAKAMQAYIARYFSSDHAQALTYDADVATWAYESADAMLVARSK